MGYWWIKLVLESSYSIEGQLLSNARLSMLSLCRTLTALPVLGDTGRLPCLFNPRQPSHLLVIESYSSPISSP